MYGFVTSYRLDRNSTLYLSGVYKSCWVSVQTSFVLYMIIRSSIPWVPNSCNIAPIIISHDNHARLQCACTWIVDTSGLVTLLKMSSLLDRALSIWSTLHFDRKLIWYTGDHFQRTSPFEQGTPQPLALNSSFYLMWAFMVLSFYH